MKRVSRFLIVLILLLTAITFGQVALTGACSGDFTGGQNDCPN